MCKELTAPSAILNYSFLQIRKNMTQTTVFVNVNKYLPDNVAKIIFPAISGLKHDLEAVI